LRFPPKSGPSVCIPPKLRVSVRSRELTIALTDVAPATVVTCRALSLPALNDSAENNVIADSRGVAVAVAKEMLKVSVLL
jgi:hypothetical protein